MASATYRVVINRIKTENRDELREELAEELDLSDEEVEELLAELPATVARNLDEDEAEDLADFLEELGARVRIVEVASRRRRGSVEEEDEYDEVVEDDDEGGRPAAGASSTRSQRIMLYGGLCILALLVGMLGMSVFGGSLGSIGCGGDFRGPGANEQLAAMLPQYAARYARGFEAQDSVAHGQLGASSSVTLRENVEGPACYVWIGLSNPGTDLDLFLRYNGQLVAQDRGEDNFPVVRHCVAEASTIEIQVQMFAGSGDWVVQRYALAGEPGSDLLTLMHKLYTSMFVVNGQPLGETKRLHLKAGQEAEIYVDMDSEWCYLPLAVSNPGTDLDMALLDPQGRVVEQDDAADNYPVVRHCPTKSGRYRLKLIMYGGESDAVYRVYRGKLGGSRPGGSSGSPARINVPGVSQPIAPTKAPAPSSGDAGPAEREGDAAPSAEPPSQPAPAEPARSRNPAKKS